MSPKWCVKAVSSSHSSLARPGAPMHCTPSHSAGAVAGSVAWFCLTADLMGTCLHICMNPPAVVVRGRGGAWAW